MDLEYLTGLLDALTLRWPQVLAVFGGIALAAGLLGALTRALGAKAEDGFKGLFRRGRAEAQPPSPAPEAQSEPE